MTEAELNELESLCEKATPGPLHGRTEEVYFETLVWVLYQGIEAEGFHGKSPIAWIKKHGDAVIFQQSREAVPQLIAEVRRLQTQYSDYSDLVRVAENRGYALREKEHSNDRNLYFQARQENARLRQELEIEYGRLAACGVAALETVRLREALEYYASEKTYSELTFNNPDNSPYGHSDYPINFDKGQRARDALEQCRHEAGQFAFRAGVADARRDTLKKGKK